MNFYKHHIGDYAQATMHLTFVEDAAYSRLLRKCYADERPLPTDVKAVQRLVGAKSRDEKDAVTNILREFFFLGSDGWRNKRADDEIKKASLQADANRQIAYEREQNRRARIVHDKSTIRSPVACDVREPSQTPDSRLQTKEKDNPPRTSYAPPPSGWLSVLKSDGVDEQVANDWLSVRKAQRAPLTDSAWRGVKREASKAGLSVAEAVRMSAENSWRGFKAEWVQGRRSDDRAARQLEVAAVLTGVRPARELEILESYDEPKLVTR